jgi:hypothetical protein
MCEMDLEKVKLHTFVTKCMKWFFYGRWVRTFLGGFKVKLGRIGEY